MGEVLERVAEIAFQSVEGQEPINDIPYINLADDGRIEVLDVHGILWRANILKVFNAIEVAKTTRIVYIQAAIPISSGLALTPGGKA